MSEWLVIRALRYQWISALVAFLCVFGAAQPLRVSISERTGLLPKSEVQASTATQTEELLDRSASGVLKQAVARDDASSVLKPSGREAFPATGLTRLVAQRRDLDTQIAATQQLLTSKIQADEVAATPPPATPPPPAHPAVIIVRRPARAEETALRTEVAEQRARVETLRGIDTDLHPDLIEAREKLAVLQGRLSAAVARDEAEARAEAQAQAAALEQQAVAQESTPITEPVEVPSPAETVMPELSRLILARARLERQIRDVAGSPQTDKAGSSQQPASLLDSAPYAPAAQLDAPSHSEPFLLFELACTVVALLVALLVAVGVEQVGDHIAGPLSLSAQLPDAVTFFRVVPRMRG